MKRVGLLLLIIGLIGIPAQGQEVERSCSPDGYTVVFVNGVFTDEDAAKADTKNLDKEYVRWGVFDDVDFKLGHNETHVNIGGFGGTDLLHSTAQALTKPIAKSDLYEILWDIHSQTETRKILLVGHSQGTYYTNEVYDYLTANGIPAQSIRVYNVAAMSDNVRGEESPHTNKYVSSSNDAVVDAVRVITQGSGLEHVQVPLPSNITIPIAPDQADGPFNVVHGHAFSDVYLDYASVQMVNEIDAQLARLEADAVGSAEGGCFTPPDRDFAYHVEDKMLMAFDAGATVINVTGEVVVTSGMWTSRKLADAIIVTGEVIGTSTEWAWRKTGEGVDKVAETTHEWWFAEGALEDNLEAATFALLTPENPADEPSTEEGEENAEEEGSVLGEETLVEDPEDPQDDDAQSQENEQENDAQEGQNVPGNEPENAENEANQEETVENQEESQSTEDVEDVDNSGTAGENTIENQEESTENDDSVNNSQEIVENQEESDKKPVDPRWGIRSGGSGRPSLPNTDAIRVFGTTMDELTEEQKTDGVTLQHGSIIGGGETLLVVWIQRVNVDITFENGTTNTYYDDLLLGRRIRSDGSWIDTEPLTLWDPIEAQQLSNITGIVHDGEFVVLLNMTDRANVYARTKIISVPDGHDGYPYSINMVRVPISGVAENPEATEIQGETWYRYHDRMPHLLNVAPLGDDLLVVYQRYDVLNAGLLTPDDDDPFVSAGIMKTGGSSNHRARSAEAICLDDYCAIYWTKHTEIQAGLLDTSGDVAGWALSGCHGDCPLKITDLHRHFAVSSSQLLLGLGEGSEYLLLWVPRTQSGTGVWGYEVAGYLGSTDDLNEDDFPEGEIDEDELLAAAEYKDGIYEVAAAQNPENGDIVVVSSETDENELLIALVSPDDPGVGVEFIAVEDVTTNPQPGISCTTTSCFISFIGTYQETEGLHLVDVSELLTGE